MILIIQVFLKPESFLNVHMTYLAALLLFNAAAFFPPFCRHMETSLCMSISFFITWGLWSLTNTSTHTCIDHKSPILLNKELGGCETFLDGCLSGTFDNTVEEVSTNVYLQRATPLKHNPPQSFNCSILMLRCSLCSNWSLMGGWGLRGCRCLLDSMCSRW